MEVNTVQGYMMTSASESVMVDETKLTDWCRAVQRCVCDRADGQKLTE